MQLGLHKAAAEPTEQREEPCEEEPVCSTSQAAAESSNQRPPSGERRYQLTVAQRAKDAASIGVLPLQRLCLTLSISPSGPSVMSALRPC